MRKRAIYPAPTTLLDALRQSPTGVFQEAEIVGLLVEHRPTWELARRESTATLLAWLVQNTSLEQLTLSSDLRDRPTMRYTWGSASPYYVALSMTRNGYLSHASALAIHGLGATASDAFYVNQEQTPKPSSAGPLAQDAVDRAFSKQQRSSRNIYRWKGLHAVVVNGKNTGRLAVQDVQAPDAAIVPVTSLERTLIDVAVRPNYASGPTEVLRAYQRAKDRIDVDVLVSILAKLSYVYPYHQLIGFYMQRAGVAASVLAPLRDLGLYLDFPLSYGMEDPDYDSEWRVRFPKALEVPSQTAGTST
jgi:hypothetical protein